MPLVPLPPEALPPPGPHLGPNPTRPPFGSVESVVVQPVAQLRHVQCLDHEQHVRRALRACPAPQPSVGPSPCMPLVPLPPEVLPPHLGPNPIRPPFESRQAASAFNQPLSFETSSLEDLGFMFVVRSTRTLGPSLESVPWLAPPTPYALSPPCPHLAPHLKSSFRLGRTRGRSTSL